MSFRQYVYEKIVGHKRFISVWLIVALTVFSIGTVLSNLGVGVILFCFSPVLTLLVYMTGALVRQVIADVYKDYEKWKSAREGKLKNLGINYGVGKSTAVRVFMETQSTYMQKKRKKD